MRLIRQRAQRIGLEVTESEGGSHTKLTVGNAKLVVGRHRELKPWETRAILRTLENEFGKRWWESE